LADTNIKISADTQFDKGGALGLVCRFTRMGRYEFLIQPDGSWFIRRNIAPWEPRANDIFTLAHGKSTAIQPEITKLPPSARVMN
jgi:hypothetical protein